MEEIIESRLNYLSIDELTEFKFLPIIPINIKYHSGMGSWVLRINGSKNKVSKSIHVVIEHWYKYCINNNLPFT